MDKMKKIKKKRKIANNNTEYSHLSNKGDVMLTDFGKFHPAQKRNPPCTFFISLQNFLYKMPECNVRLEPNEDFSQDHFEL